MNQLLSEMLKIDEVLLGSNQTSAILIRGAGFYAPVAQFVAAKDV